MSLILKRIIRDYRAVISSRPDGEIHIRDNEGITHVVTGHGLEDTLITACSYVANICVGSPVIITWDPVNCMTCLIKRAS